MENYNKLHEKLNSYKQLEDNWDGYGGIKPSEQLIEVVNNFLLVLKKENIRAPKIMLSGSNAIGLFWSKKDYYLELNFDNEKEYSYFSYFSEIDKKISGKDEVLISEKIDEEIKQIASLF